MTILLQGAGIQAVVSTPPDPIGDTLRADAIAYWKMDEISGTRADATERGNDLTPVNSPSAISGVQGNAIDFLKDSQQYLGRTNTNDLQVRDSSFTFAFWFRYTGTFDVNVASQEIIGKESEYGISLIYLIRDLTITFFLTDVDFGVPAVTNTILDYVIGTWIFIESFCDQTGKIISLNIDNGTPNQIAIVGGGDTSDVDRFGIGMQLYSFPTLNRPLQGSVDEVGLWKRLLTTDERDYLYNSGAGRSLFP